MPNLGSLFTSGWIAGQGEKDLAEGVVKDPDIGWFSHLLRNFPLVRSFAKAAAKEAPVAAQPVSLVGRSTATDAQAWADGWEAHWNNVAAALREPVVEGPRPLDEALGQAPPSSDE
jgi:hypothetical protein